MKSFPWQILLDWFDTNGRHDFPWRQYEQDASGCYRIWLAEILLQQTQADRVISFYRAILEKYPTIQDLAQASYEEFFPYYQGLGYYSRARNLLKTAKVVSEDYGGIFPKEKSLLKCLPGVGEYTARAILAFGYQEVLLAWDTNLETVFSRYYKGGKNTKLSTEEKEKIEIDLRNFIQSTHTTAITTDLVRDINNALMDWARLSEPKNASQLDQKKYIFTESAFYISQGANEIIEKKVSQYFPIPDARVIVTLHQNHKIYYSLSQESYSPFTLDPSLDRDTRKYVQAYFRDSYGLELSVRPIHKKWITEAGHPYIAVNAQVQAGENPFTMWDKKYKKILSE